MHNCTILVNHTQSAENSGKNNQKLGKCTLFIQFWQRSPDFGVHHSNLVQKCVLYVKLAMPLIAC